MDWGQRRFLSRLGEGSEGGQRFSRRFLHPEKRVGAVFLPELRRDVIPEEKGTRV